MNKNYLRDKTADNTQAHSPNFAVLLGGANGVRRQQPHGTGI